MSVQSIEPAPLRALPLPDCTAPALSRAELLELAAGCEPVGHRQGVLELVRADTSRPAPQRATRAGGTESGPPASVHPLPVRSLSIHGSRRQQTPTKLLPEAQLWAPRVTLALIEVVAGYRPATQVARFISPAVYRSLLRRSSRAVRRTERVARQPIRVRSVRVTHPVEGAAEASVIVQEGSRVRAVALRLQGYDGRWVVEALETA